MCTSYLNKYISLNIYYYKNYAAIDTNTIQFYWVGELTVDVKDRNNYKASILA